MNYPNNSRAKYRSIFYDKDDCTLNVHIEGKQNDPSLSNVYKSSMKNTLEEFDKNFDGTLSPRIKSLCIYSIKRNLRKYKFVMFDTAEQKWYSENYPNDPGLVATPASEKNEDRKKPKKIAINKYSGRLPLHESVIIGETQKFVTLHNSMVPEYIPKIDTGFGITYYPNGKINTVTPLPYIFDSEEQLMKYVKTAQTETYDTLYLKVEKAIKRYVNVEEYYYPILIGDIIWSYFQDRFGYTHYLIFTGDNGSGKNSALLVFKYLGYRVFYIVSHTRIHRII